MPFALGWSLRWKLIVLSLCVLLPFVAFSYYLVQENVEATKRQILSSSAATADIVAYQVDDLVQSTEKLLLTLWENEALKGQMESDATSLLMDAVVLHEDYKIIFGLRKDGSIFASGITKGMLYDNVASQRYLTDALTRESATVSGRLPSEIGGEPVVNIIVPVGDKDDAVAGGIGAGVSLTNLQKRLTSSDVQAHRATVMVLDSAGKVLIHPDWTYVKKDVSLAGFPPVQASLARQGRGTIEYVDPHDGRTYLAAYAPAKSAGWAVVVAYPADLAYIPVKTAASKGLVGISMIASFALLTTLFFTTWLTRPISELSKKTKVVMNALSGHTSLPPARDEVQQLCQAIEVMSNDLIRYADELAGTRREIDKKVQELRELTTKVVNVREEERKVLALEVHDGLAQLVAGALLQAKAVEVYMGVEPEAAMRRLRATEKMLDQAVAEVKRVMLELHPARLEGGLAGAVQRNLASLQDACDIESQLNVIGIPHEIPCDIEAAAYRIVQEALNNVRKHAQATKIDVAIRYEPSAVTIVVADNGHGFDPEQVRPAGDGGLGLLGMRERAAKMGASLAISSSRGRGTLVSLQVPLDQQENVLVPWAQAGASDLSA